MKQNILKDLDAQYDGLNNIQKSLEKLLKQCKIIKQVRTAKEQKLPGLGDVTYEENSTE